MSSTDKKPVVRLVAETCLNAHQLTQYLEDTHNAAHIKAMIEAYGQGLSEMEVLVSTMAKLCYKSLSLGHNDNIGRIRGIRDNIEAAIESEHGSVLEHASMSFIVYDCSRIFTHELVRHRAGTAFSQNSGRYIRLDQIDLVLDPILEPIRHEVEGILIHMEEVYRMAAERLGLNDKSLTFDVKKKITSALRRIAPNGQTNEIGFTANLRALRFIIGKRTHRSAEWEIRYVFSQVFELVKKRVPTLFCDANVEMVDGLPEVQFTRHT